MDVDFYEYIFYIHKQKWSISCCKEKPEYKEAGSWQMTNKWWPEQVATNGGPFSMDKEVISPGSEYQLRGGIRAVRECRALSTSRVLTNGTFHIGEIKRYIQVFRLKRNCRSRWVATNSGHFPWQNEVISPGSGYQLRGSLWGYKGMFGPSYCQLQFWRNSAKFANF